MATATRTAARASLAGLYVLTPDLDDTDVLVARVGAAVAGGATAVQYRHKRAAPALRLHQARLLRELCAARGVMFIVNDNADLALAVDAAGVHLGRDDMSVSAARARLGRAAIIGVSCYDSLDRAAEAVRGGADYIAFGSFFPSTVKPGAVRASPALLTAAKARWGVPVVAIGGITAANGPALIEAGADAVAVITAVFGAGNVTAAAAAICDVVAAARARPARVWT
ncbi:MAG: thiamine phosphate synthase [Casimicrobiaceae bacterium]